MGEDGQVSAPVPRHFDLAVIGTGSGNSLVDERFADRSVALLERGTFGGTCLNVGCIPTKMLVYPADLARGAMHGPALGVDTLSRGADWPRIRDRVFGRIDPISASGRTWRASGENVTLYEGEARFVGPRTLDTGTGEVITADQVVIAAGSRPVVPDLPGLADAGFHTSDTVMRLDELPRRLLVMGGGYIAAEFAHVFGAFGTAVTIVNRTDALLRTQDDDVSRRFTALAQEQWDVRLKTTITRVERLDATTTRAYLDDGSTVDADVVLVAVGRRSNADTLEVSATGVEVDDDDVVVVDAHQRTSADGIWALGDIANHDQLKHVSNQEARVVQHNLLHLDDPSAWVETDRHAVPSAVFSSPQVAQVGSTERELVERRIPYVSAEQDYGSTAYGWAMEDTTHFAKVLADPVTGLLLGAHVMGPQASLLVQPLIQAMAFDQTAHEVARGQYWIHPALTEVVENLLLALPESIVPLHGVTLRGRV
jgi:mycothione reductase